MVMNYQKCIWKLPVNVLMAINIWGMGVKHPMQRSGNAFEGFNLPSADKKCGCCCRASNTASVQARRIVDS